MSLLSRVWLVFPLVIYLLFYPVNGKDVRYRFQRDVGELEEDAQIKLHHLRQRRQVASDISPYSYYDVETIPDALDKFWVDLELEGVVPDETLSDAYRLAQPKNLSKDFGFRFYGEEIQKVLVGTGGFIYMSDFVHQFLTASQYVAPLMAGFSTENVNSSIFVNGSTSRFVVTWKNVYLKDQNLDEAFTFQVILRNDHSITFVYKQVPILVKDISENSHPVKVGVSDAYYMDRTVGSNTRRAIFEYHRVPISKELVQSGTVIILRPLPTCNTANTCEECFNITAVDTCRWCHVTNRCSNGTDRHRQEWIENSCPESSVDSSANCTISTTMGSTVTSPTTTSSTTATTEMAEPSTCSSGDPGCKGKDEGDAVNLALLALAAFIAAMLGAGAWFFLSRLFGN